MFLLNVTLIMIAERLFDISFMGSIKDAGSTLLGGAVVAYFVLLLVGDIRRAMD